MVIKIWCEWDYGQDELIFKNRNTAMVWLLNNLVIIEQANQEGLSVNELLEEWQQDGYLGFTPLTVIGE